MDTYRIRHKTGWLLLMIILSAGSVMAGNLRVGDQVKVASVENDYFTLSLSVGWENSWYDDYNFDAAWVFIKYRTQDMPDWMHLPLSADGHDAGSNGGWMTGESGSEVVGLFVWSRTTVDGKAELDCRVKCAIPYGLTRADVEQNRLYFAVQAVEMVYVPAGAYYLGDGAAQAAFCQPGGVAPVLVESEAALNLADSEGGTYALEAGYPKGYDGFFCMKTEISQKQYVDFLNLLTLTQQYARVGGLYSMAEGNYIFNNAATPTVRNGIRLKKKSSDTSVPCIFINDLNNNGVEGDADDGETLACNYLSAEDVFAYCAWAGLRPLTETEFEKAGRKLFPEQPVANGYPWNAATEAMAVTEADLSGKNTGNETAAGKNVNAGGFSAPVRGGAFGGSTAQQAGATFWGVFQMGGNLRECCIPVYSTDFTSLCGNGDVENFSWSGAMARGGGFNSALTALQVSDRSGLAEVGDISAREPDFGGRACRSVPAGNAGEIAAADRTASVKVCVGETAKVISVALPTAVEGMTYRWVVRKGEGSEWTEIAGKTEATLEYEPAVRHPGTSRYYVRRIAHSRWGEWLSNEVELVFIHNNLQVTCLKDTVDQCGEAKVIEASHQEGGKISWLVNGTVLQEEDGIGGTGYVPDRSIGTAGAEVELICRSVINGCTQAVSIPVYIAPEATDPAACWSCGDLVKDDAGNEYGTVATAEGRCWMQENMRIELPESYVQPAAGGNIQTYGRLYTWEVAMNGKNYEGTRGICPEGWHIPTNAEWWSLINALGKTTAGTTLQGSTLRLTLGGSRNAGTNNYVGLDERGDYWSSSLYDSATVWGITIKKDQSTVAEYKLGPANAVSVRCIRNK